MTAAGQLTVVLVPVDEFGCGPLRIQLTKFKHVLQEHLGSRANVEIQYGGVPAAGPDVLLTMFRNRRLTVDGVSATAWAGKTDVHVFRVVHSQEASVRAESRVHGPDVIEFVPRKYKHCQNDLLVYFEEGTDQLKPFGARSAVARVCGQCGLKDSSTVRVVTALLIGGVVVSGLSLLSYWLWCEQKKRQEILERIGTVEEALRRLRAEDREPSNASLQWVADAFLLCKQFLWPGK